MRVTRFFGFLLATLVASLPARADFPDKTIRIVVPYTPGGFNDTLGRIVAQKFTDDWGVPAVVENRPAAAADRHHAVMAPADGYTLLVSRFRSQSEPLYEAALRHAEGLRRWSSPASPQIFSS